MRKKSFFLLYTIIICMVLSNTIVYAATGPKGLIKGNGTINPYDMTVQALKGNEGIELHISILSNASEYIIPDRLKKVQIKLFNQDGNHVLTENFFNIPLNNGVGVVRLNNISGYRKLEVVASVQTSQSVDQEILREDSVTLALIPDLSIEAVDAPQITLVNTDCNVNVVVSEVNGYSSASFKIEVLNDTNILASTGILMVQAGGTYTSVMNLSFKQPGNYSLRVRVAQVTPGDNDISNNEKSLGIHVDRLPAPQVISVEAADTGNGDGLNSGDTITVKFDTNTNRPPVDTKYGVDSIIEIGPGKSLGNNYSGTWVDAKTLVIGIIDAAGGNVTVGDVITIKPYGNLTNTDNTSESCSSRFVIGGTFGDNKVVTVGFKDPNLEYAVRKALYMPQGDITNVDMAKLMRLIVSGRGIKDLSGLEYAINLNTLYLSGNQIADIASLGSLQKLRELYIDGNIIDNISVLSNLQNLQVLEISRNLVSDISPLGKLTALEKLDASSNKISDIQALNSMANIQELNLSNNMISDVSSLGSLTKLVSLNLSYNSISSVKSLANLSGLVSLSIQKNQCSDLSPVKGLLSLQYLNCSENSITDVSFLSELANLSKLNIASNSIVDISSLAMLINIETLDISRNPVSDISAVKNLVKISSLKLDSSKVSDITPLLQLKNMQSLYMSGCEVVDISALAGLANIHTLMLSGNRISDIFPLQGLNNLRWVNISRNQITDLTPLVINSQNGGLGSGDYIDIANNQLILSEGSKDMKDIQTLTNTGVMVKYMP